MIRAFVEVAALQTAWWQGWLWLVVILISGVCLGLMVVIAQLVVEAWEARRRQREVTEEAVRSVEPRQTHARIRRLVDEEQRRRLAAAARTGRHE